MLETLYLYIHGEQVDPTRTAKTLSRMTHYK